MKTLRLAVLLAALFTTGCNCGEGERPGSPDGGSPVGGGGPGGLGGGFAGAADGGLVVRDDVMSETTWAAGPGDCDVIVDDVIRIRARLVIGAGTKVCFRANAGLLVESTGSLSAVGTVENPILLTGTSTTPGYWRGVAFLSNDVANALHFTEMTYAGSAQEFCCGFFFGAEQLRGAVVVGDVSKTARVSIQNTTIANSGAMGVTVHRGSRLTGFSSNTFRANASFPVSIPISTASDLDSLTVYSGGAMPNMKNEVRVLDFDTKTDAPVTLRKLDVPYAMNAGIENSVFDIGAPLTIQAGARLEFEANSGFRVLSTGSLKTEGTATARVTLTAKSATPGYWKGVALMSLTNSISSTDITFAGSDEPFCCGFYEPGPGGRSTKAGLVVGDFSVSGAVVFSDSTVTQSKARGVSVIKGSFTPMGAVDVTTGNGSPNLMP